jgi:hypothetical protein
MNSKSSGQDAIALMGLSATMGGLYVDPPANHPIYTQIGIVANQWSGLERILDIAIGHLLDVPHPLAACLRAQITGLHNRVEAIKALLIVRDLDPKLLKKLEEFSNKCRDPQEWRNRIVHDPWYLDLKTKSTAQWKSLPRKDLRYGMKPVDQAYITKTLERIPQCFEAARKLNDQIYAALQASKEKPHEPPA